MKNLKNNNKKRVFLSIFDCRKNSFLIFLPFFLLISFIAFFSSSKYQSSVIEGELARAKNIAEVQVYSNSSISFKNKNEILRLYEKFIKEDEDLLEISAFLNKKGSVSEMVFSTSLADISPPVSEKLWSVDDKSKIHYYIDNNEFLVKIPLTFKGRRNGFIQIRSKVTDYRKNYYSIFYLSMGGFLLFFLIINRYLKIYFFIPMEMIFKDMKQLSLGSCNEKFHFSGFAKEAGHSLELIRLSIKARIDLFTRELETNSVVSIIDQTVLSCSEPKEVMDFAVRTVGNFLGADRTSLVFLNDNISSIKFFALSDNLNVKIVDGAGLLVDHSWALNEAISKLKPVLVDDLLSMHKGLKGKYPIDDKLIESGIKSILIIPLIIKGKLLGTINFGKTDIEGFCEDDQIVAVRFGNQVAIALDNSVLYQKVKKETDTLNTLLVITGEVNSIVFMPELLDKIVHSIQKLMGADTVSIMLLDNQGEYLETKASTAKRKDCSHENKIKVGDGVAGSAAVTGEHIIIHDDVDERIYKRYKQHEKKIASSITMPLNKGRGGDLIGVLCVSSYDYTKKFGDDDLKFLRLLVAQFSLSIENAKLFEGLKTVTSQLRESHYDVVKALSDALDIKDVCSSEHANRMLQYSKLISEKLNVTDDQREEIIYGTLLHDIGKIAIPDAILSKKTKLTPSEIEKIQTHPAKGAEILTKVKSLSNVVKTVYYHQERVDGTGYPEGLAGLNIPLGARVVGVLDAYDAMTNERAYRSPMSKKAAIEELLRYSGKQFDSDIVRVFLEILEEEEKAEDELFYGEGIREII